MVAAASSSMARRALAMMMIASVISLLDRQILSLLLIPIRADLGISDTEVSLLQGLAFAAVYAFAGLPIGYAADRLNRRNIIIIGIVMWSVMTALCGLANDFQALFLARVGVGLGEACLHPAAYSLISDYFPRQQRGRAYGMFGAAATIGISVSLFAGAAVIGLLGQDGVTIWPFGHLAMWKAAFLVASLPGFVVAVALLFIREPERQEIAAVQHGSAGFAAFLWRRRGVVALVFAGYGLINFAGYGVLAWMATAYVRIYGLSLASAGFMVGLVMLFASLIGAFIGGTLADRWNKRGTPGGRFRVVVLSGTVGALAFAGWWTVDNFALSLLLGVIAFTMQVASTSTAPSVISDLAPNQFRGQLSALYLLITGLGGIAAGPTAIAFVSDTAFGYDDGLRWAMVMVTVPALLLAALLAWIFRGYYSRIVAQSPDGRTPPEPDAPFQGKRMTI